MNNTPHIIVLGNEKGGTGKSTIAMHITVFLLQHGSKVGTIDVDARQGTFSRYLEHRKISASQYNNILLPKHVALFKSENTHEAEKEDTESIKKTVESFNDIDFLVIDTPGNDTFLSRAAHSYADTLITPLNDSFVDIDVLVRVSQNNVKTFRPSIYAEMLWNQRKERAIRGNKPIDWIVIRNRMTTLYTKNRRDTNIVLEALSKRIGFRLSEGFCERVVFKELFIQGLTLLDLDSLSTQLSLSHIAARQELRDLISCMKLPKLS